MTQKWGFLSSHIVPCGVVDTVSIFAAVGGVYDASDGGGENNSGWNETTKDYGQPHKAPADIAHCAEQKH